MLKKRGLILILILLVLVNPVDSAPRSATVIEDTPPSSYLSCSDGTRFAACKEGTNLFCSNQNIILNSGFESDSNQDGIPNLFSPDPNAILGTDLLISQDSLAGLKSILITKQWASFDYQASLGATVLQPSTDYVFFSFVKGTCDNLRVYYSQQQTGSANELCGSSRVCTLIPIVNGWSRLVTQFSSDEIVTTIPQGNVQVPIIQNLRVECADSTLFELFIDNMHLQPLNAPPQLIENCQICSSCSNGLFCAPDGSCVSDLSRFYTDEELMEKCIAENNFALCERIQDAAKKPIAFNQFAVENNDITKCQDVICEQSVLYFSCLDQGRANCNEEIFQNYEINPSFKTGRKIYVRDNKDENELKRYEFSGDNFDEVRCDIHVQERKVGSFSFDTVKDEFWCGVNAGTIVNHNEGNSFWDYISNKECENSAFASCTQGSSLLCFDVLKQSFGSVINRIKDCNDSNCELLTPGQPNGELPLNTPKTDLLCGYNDKWYLCDRDGIQEFSNGERFLCNSATGTWIRLN